MRLDLTPLDDAIAQLEEALEFHGSDLASRNPALKLHRRDRLRQRNETLDAD